MRSAESGSIDFMEGWAAFDLAEAHMAEKGLALL